ncbi:MAG TPA: M2 family metallopeptidase [Gemmatimonadaceae bacterium]|nr:M2 family metallopeptidase [Gemmatimonadaceae bacterium]
MHDNRRHPDRRAVAGVVAPLLVLLALGACVSAPPAAAPAPAPAPAAAPAAATATPPSFSAEVDRFLADYSARYQQLYYAAQLADWESNTHIVAGDTTNAARTKREKEALARFVGSNENVSRIRGYLARRGELSPLQVRQLETMLYNAGESPEAAADVVRRRIAAETEQVEKLYGYTFKLRGKAVTPNQIDSILRVSTSLTTRRAAWEASKEVGPVLKPGLVALRDLRNQTVQALGYPDYFTYQVSDYGMTTPEMMALLDTMNVQLRPLYRELHTWARYELARRYKRPVPALIPADWLPNRWGQSWADLVTVQGLNVDSAVGRHTPEWVVQQAEGLYVSLGFDSLPRTFWEKSSLYDVPASAGYKKNTHASAWHMDLDKDVRSLMSVEANADWYETAMHELGHIYYYQAYSTPAVPLVLRSGANRAYHEGIGSMMGLASSQRRFLADRGLVPATPATPDEKTAQLLKEALNFVVFIPFSAGTMSRWEHDFYASRLSADSMNARWWEYARRYQGIAPPAGPRGEQYADAATKTHINDDPAQYYDYALSNALLIQLHTHIATDILHQDPHDTDYYGNKAVGDFLRTLMAPGASRPWREVLKETTGRELDARAMVEYFQPLYEWLRIQNRGRTATLPEL